jgi:hypothetical protein
VKSADSEVWLAVPTAVTTKMAVFWVVAPCRPVCVYQSFRGPYCLHLQCNETREAVQTSETLVISYQSIRHYNPEDSHLLINNEASHYAVFLSSHLRHKSRYSPLHPILKQPLPLQTEAEFHIYETRGKPRILKNLILTFLDRRLEFTR